MVRGQAWEQMGTSVKKIYASDIPGTEIDTENFWRESRFDDNGEGSEYE
jgi:hypothetical protein